MFEVTPTHARSSTAFVCICVRSHPGCQRRNGHIGANRFSDAPRAHGESVYPGRIGRSRGQSAHRRPLRNVGPAGHHGQSPGCRDHHRDRSGRPRRARRLHDALHQRGRFDTVEHVQEHALRPGARFDARRPDRPVPVPAGRQFERAREIRAGADRARESAAGADHRRLICCTCPTKAAGLRPRTSSAGR